MKFGYNRPSSYEGDVIRNCRRTDDGLKTDDGRRTTKPAYTISSPGVFGSGLASVDVTRCRINTELNDLRKLVSLRKSEVSVGRLSVCKVIEDLRSMAHTVCYAPISIAS